MENQDFLQDRLEERTGLFKGAFAKGGRKVQALQDACKSLLEENDTLQKEVKAKDKAIAALTDYLNQCLASMPPPESWPTAETEDQSKLKA